jgi:hypothetical protein
MLYADGRRIAQFLIIKKSSHEKQISCISLYSHQHNDSASIACAKD